jgi:transposase-like protein
LRTRRTFTKQFKENAVHRAEVVPAVEVARACEIDVTLLHRWRRQLSTTPANGASSRPNYSREFKRDAVARLDEGESVHEVAHVLAVNDKALRRWRDESQKYGSNAFSGYGKNRSYTPPTQAVRISLTAAEYARVRSAYSVSSARSLPDFARSQVLREDVEPSVAEIEYRLDQLTRTLQQIAGVLQRSVPAPQSRAATSSGEAANANNS